MTDPSVTEPETVDDKLDDIELDMDVLSEAFEHAEGPQDDEDE